MTEQEKFNELARGMEQVNREMAFKIDEDAPYCHCRKMRWQSEEGMNWWECEVCGHTKSI